MKFTIKREYFLKALLDSSRVVFSNSSDPILSTIKLELFENRLEITGSNGSISIKNIVPRFLNDQEIIRDIKVGGILVNSKTLVDIVRNLDDDEISFPVEDNVLVKIENSRSSYSINAIRVEEYREIDFEEEGTELVINSSDLINAVNQTTFAASTKENRALLSCLNIESSGNKLIFTCTDSARLAKSEIVYKEDLPKITVNVNAKNFSDGIKSLRENEEVHLFISDNKLLIKGNDFVISFTIVLGDYPNTKNLLLRSFNFKLEVQTNEFLKILNRIVIFALERANIVKLTMTENNVVLSCKSQLLGEANEKFSLYQYSGNRLEISFNVKYVADAIRSLKSETVVLSFAGEMKPFTITDKNNSNVVHLITPVRTY